MSTIGKSLVATGAAALLLSLASVAPAQAGGKKFHFHGHHGHHHHHGLHFHTGGYGGGYGGCGYFKRMWWKTGNYYWKAKYYDCRAW